MSIHTDIVFPRAMSGEGPGGDIVQFLPPTLCYNYALVNFAYPKLQQEYLSNYGWHGYTEEIYIAICTSK